MPAPDQQRDDVDRIYAHLESVAPPADFVARVMARARQSDAVRWPRWQQAGFGVLYVVALVALAVLAYLTGRELEHAGLRDLLSLAIHDLTLVRDSPGVYLAALRDAIPWLHLLAVTLDVVLLAIATRLVLRVTRPIAGPSSGALTRSV